MKNKPCILFLSLILTTFFAGLSIAATPLFSIVAKTPIPQSLIANRLTTIQYQVTNNTKKARTLTMVAIPGVTQVSNGVLACAKAFNLAPGQSCFLNLQLNASLIPQKLVSGPVICKTKSAYDLSPDPFLCVQPSIQESFNLTINPCNSSNCLPAPLTNQLRQIATNYSQTYNLPGLLIGVWHPGQGELIIEQGLGDVNVNRPISISDHLRVGSITKTFTIEVILQLIQENRLNLTDPLNLFIAGVQNGTATIAELANMKSGIYNYTEDQTFALALITNLTAKWTVQQLIDAANQNLPYFPAGQNWHYSNTNTVLLGQIIENITGNPVELEIQNRILNPLGLKNTVYPATPAMPFPFARGYEVNPIEEYSFVDPSSSRAAGAMISTLGDLKIWVEALTEGTLISPSLHNQQLNSLENIIYSPCADNNGRVVNCPEYDKYGIGLGEINGWVGHTGEYIGYSSLMMHNLNTGATVVILTNTFGLGVHVPTKIFEEYSMLLN